MRGGHRYAATCVHLPALRSTHLLNYTLLRANLLCTSPTAHGKRLFWSTDPITLRYSLLPAQKGMFPGCSEVRNLLPSPRGPMRRKAAGSSAEEGTSSSLLASPTCCDSLLRGAACRPYRKPRAQLQISVDSLVQATDYLGPYPLPA